uniref:Voltage-gated hydrogen channel 1 n=1 Tax=Schistocephalus solidus TaxID=70667 RepID=A0A0X3PUC0_SCHSO
MERVIQEAMRSKLPKAFSFASNNSKDTDEDIRYNYDLGWTNSKTFTKQLAKDNIDVDILNDELMRHAERRRSRRFQERLLSKLRSSAAQFLLCFLVLLDSCLVIAEIILEIRSIQNFKQLFTIKGRELGSLMLTQALKNTALNTSCLNSEGSNKVPPSSNEIHTETANGFQRLFSHTVLNDERTIEELDNFILCWQKLFLLGDNPSQSHDSQILCESDLLSKCSVVSQTSSAEKELNENLTDPSSLHFASEVMHFISIGVTSLFIVCIVLKLVCLRRKFFTNVYEVIDALVILVSFLSDICYVRVDSQEISAMVVLLLWRIARLINAMLMYERQRCEFRVTLQKRARRLEEKKVDILERDKELFQKQISALEELSRSLGSPEENIRDCKPRYVRHSKEQTQNALKSIAALTTGFMGGMIGAPISRQEELARFAGNNNAGSPLPPNTHMTESLTNSGLFLSRENISGGACDSLNSGSRVSMKTNSLNSNELFSCGENNAPSNNYSKRAQLMRSRADNLVRNVIMRQMSNALEEAQDSPRRRFGLFKDHKQLVKLEGDNGPLKNLISGNYDAFSNCYRTRNNSETLRRKTLCDIYSAQKIKRQAISLDNDDSDSVINDAIATESDGTNSRDQHQLLLPRLEPVPSIDAQEDEVFGENDVIHSETSEVSCETNPAPPTTVGTVEPCPPTSRPQILINSHVFHSKVLIGESRSTEVLQPRNEKHEDVRQETAVLRRNSCTKAADCLLSPEPVNRKYNEFLGGPSSTIFRTASERRFCVSPVVSVRLPYNFCILCVKQWIFSRLF